MLDDADDPQPWLGSLPSGPGQLLITSADPAWRELGTVLTVPELARTEAVALLRARRPGLPVGDAALVATALHDQPAAVDVAAATLAATSLGADGLLRRLAGPRAADPDAGPVAWTWALAVDLLAADDPAATGLLHLLAWLGPDPVPLSLLGGHPAALPEPLAAVRTPVELAERVETLRRRGLVQICGEAVWLPRWAARLTLSRGGPGSGAIERRRVARRRGSAAAGRGARGTGRPAAYLAQLATVAATGTHRDRPGPPARPGRHRRRLAARPSRRLPAGPWPAHGGPGAVRGRV